MTAIKQTVTVEPGGVAQVRSPDLREGEKAEVIVLVEPSTAPENSHQTWTDFIGAVKGNFKDAAEVDACVRELRDEWD